MTHPSEPLQQIPSPRRPSHQEATAMFKNYLTIAARNLLKNKLYSGINIIGLSVGLTCCLAISLYIYDEFSYDRFHSRSADIYRVTGDWKDYSLEMVNVYDFVEWLNKLEEEGIQIAGFPMAMQNAVVVSANEMKNHLIYELQQYE